ncbi:MAG TPA: L-threonylcarbamoyladenylate synthase [Tepidisphaeraceae bacterium]
MSQIQRAAELLRAGGLVAFPTETVYGLGADATSARAITKIYQAKGRPSTNPLICHVADASGAKRYARTWPRAAEILVEAFWPGPLTIVLPKNPIIVDEATAGLDSVGLRAPNHPLTLELLNRFDGAVAGPSANRSNHISPTTADHVRQELGKSVDLILDGGSCAVGIESTVLDLTRDVPRILRPGAVSREQIEAQIGPVQFRNDVVEASKAAASPGQHARHYSPIKPAYRFEASLRDRVLGRFESDENAPFSMLLIDPSVQGLLVPADRGRLGPGFRYALPADPMIYARKLYETLRMIDETDAQSIFVEMPPDTPGWTAVRDRLSRATTPLPSSLL